MNYNFEFTDYIECNGNFVKLRIPLSVIGSPKTIQLHMSFINTQNEGEFSLAAVPATSFSDSYNPSYAKFYNFNLSSSMAPNVYPAQP